jgi:Restriction endonuclease
MEPFSACSKSDGSCCAEPRAGTRSVPKMGSLILRRTQERKRTSARSSGERRTRDSNRHHSRLFDVLLKLPAAGFERLSQPLLREAGFVQVVVTGRSGDGGIDG